MITKIKSLFKRKPSEQERELSIRLQALVKENHRLDEGFFNEKKENRRLTAENVGLRLDLEEARKDAGQQLDRADVLAKDNHIMRVEKERAESQYVFASQLAHNLKSENTKLRAELAMHNAPESKLRAYVMSLRVHEMQDRTNQTGYGVTAFIPRHVLALMHNAKVKDALEFASVIAVELVDRALKGMWHINSRGNRCALIFDPTTGGAAGAVFDTPNGPEMKLATPPKGEPKNNLQLLGNNPEAAEKFHKSITRAECLDERAWLADQAARETKGDIQKLIDDGKLPREAGE